MPGKPALLPGILADVESPAALLDVLLGPVTMESSRNDGEACG